MQLEEFLKRFRELRTKTPRVFSSSRDNENSLYTEAIAYSKNTYWFFAGGWLEDCYYGEFAVKC